ncbi:MAG: exo-alpha-sialidase, partial [Clostridia bacterium]|nr:exo-alpha-sialidase [Clostridia bacterium]
MRKIILLLFFEVILILPSLLFGCKSYDVKETTAVSTEAVLQPKPVENPLIHSIDELNITDYGYDSAKGNENRASLVKDYRSSYTLAPSDFGGIEVYYPRIKKIDDDRYLLIFHNGIYGGSIYCCESSDCINWSKPKQIFQQSVISVNGNSDNLKYMTPDACVLSDGRIICVTAYRAEFTYYTKLDENGIAVSFSEDEGKTWSKPKIIYKGLNWEPSVLEAENGEIYVYFTAIAPSIHLYGYDNVSAGVGMIRSKDGGKTWIPDVMTEPYQSQYVMRQYVGTNENGIKIYNDGMPVARQLHNGSIALVVETFKDNNYMFSVSYNDDGYKEDLGLDKSGPDNRQTNLFNLAGPYITQFDSGETVLTYHWAGTMRYRIGTSDAKTFFDENVILDGVGMWGSVELTSSHSAVMAIGTDQYSLKVAKVYLNHDISAIKMTPTFTANTPEWDNNTDAIFVSGSSQAQMSVRIAHDDYFVYILGERLDDYITENDGSEFHILDGKGGKYIISVSGANVSVKHQEGQKGKIIDIDAADEGFRS